MVRIRCHYPDLKVSALLCNTASPEAIGMHLLAHVLRQGISPNSTNRKENVKSMEINFAGNMTF